MAGTVTVTEVCQANAVKITWSWTCTAGGVASLVTTKEYYGQVSSLRTVPGAAGAAPTDNYDVTITDADGYDVLQGAGADRDTANAEQAVPAALSMAYGPLTLNVANAGNAKSGTATLLIKGVQQG